LQGRRSQGKGKRVSRRATVKAGPAGAQHLGAEPLARCIQFVPEPGWGFGAAAGRSAVPRKTAISAGAIAQAPEQAEVRAHAVAKPAFHALQSRLGLTKRPVEVD
jgi:hypothetical protein